jgi:hypothetical protein
LLIIFLHFLFFVITRRKTSTKVAFPFREKEKLRNIVGAEAACNHANKIEYGDKNERNYWKVRNSWGSHGRRMTLVRLPSLIV